VDRWLGNSKRFIQQRASLERISPPPAGGGEIQIPV
jgi:hypothetical protein